MNIAFSTSKIRRFTDNSPSDAIVTMFQVIGCDQVCVCVCVCVCANYYVYEHALSRSVGRNAIIVTPICVIHCS